MQGNSRNFWVLKKNQVFHLSWRYTLPFVLYSVAGQSATKRGGDG
jgi:hypothetical protein